MLTLIYEEQLDNARQIIADDKTFQPEILIWRGRYVTDTIFECPDPMTQAIALINQTRPDGYSFPGEAWKAQLSKSAKVEKWGDITTLESKTEAFS